MRDITILLTWGEAVQRQPTEQVLGVAVAERCVRADPLGAVEADTQQRLASRVLFKRRGEDDHFASIQELTLIIITDKIIATSQI